MYEKGAEFYAIATNSSTKSPKNPGASEMEQTHAIMPRWVKINVDGLVMGSCKKACGGGILRNSASDLILGFIRNLGTTSSIKVELWALKMTLFYLCSWYLITLMQKWMLKFWFICL